MANIIMLVGGSRSGKSIIAEKMASQLSAGEMRPVYYLATATVWDEEFAGRIEKHRERRPKAWQTIEEACDIGSALENIKDSGGIFLVDGIGTWVANLMYKNNVEEFVWNIEKEKDFFRQVDGFLNTCHNRTGTIILVADEVGMAIVPENEQARIFRDLNGWTNQRLAEAANEVYIVSCGIPLQIK